jgi:hypothetical protein
MILYRRVGKSADYRAAGFERAQLAVATPTSDAAVISVRGRFNWRAAKPVG